MIIVDHPFYCGQVTLIVSQDSSFKKLLGRIRSRPTEKRRA
jgi:hypothetical protein